MHRVSNPPRGPRNGSPALRTNVGRGGIQKRGRTGESPRIDRDGDLLMDAAGEKRRSGRGRLDSPKTAVSARGGGGPPRGPRHGSRAQAGIARGLGGKQVNVVGSRPRLTATLEVYGLAQSKAASNPDGGLQTLLEFIERKANAKSPKPIKIKKVHSKEGRSSQSLWHGLITLESGQLFYPSWILTSPASANLHPPPPAHSHSSISC